MPAPRFAVSLFPIMAYRRLIRPAPFLLLMVIGLGKVPAVFAQLPTIAPRTVTVVLPDVPLVPIRRRTAEHPWRVGLPTGLYINRLPVPQTLNGWYCGRLGWTADELVGQLPPGHIRRVQRFSQAAFQTLYGPSSTGADGAWFIQVSGEKQLLRALRRDGARPWPRRLNKRSYAR